MSEVPSEPTVAACRRACCQKEKNRSLIVWVFGVDIYAIKNMMDCLSRTFFNRSIGW